MRLEKRKGCGERECGIYSYGEGYGKSGCRERHCELERTGGEKRPWIMDISISLQRYFEKCLSSRSQA